MIVIYHRQIQRDIRVALAYYEAEGGRKLGDRFFAEVEATVAMVTKNPRGFYFATSQFRRASLHTFPYHFIFDETTQRIRFLVLRHDKRHPDFGLHRK